MFIQAPLVDIEVELYFVGDEDHGPFTPCNELKSLYYIVGKAKSLMETCGVDLEFNIFLQKLLLIIPDRIELFAKRNLGNYSDINRYSDGSIDHGDLLNWSQLNREMKMKVVIANVPGCGKKFVATEDIKIGCTVFSIPEVKLIDESCLGPEMHEVLKGVMSCDSRRKLLWCMRERFKKDSEFKVYFDSLPNDDFRTGEQCYLSCGNLSGADLVAFHGFLPKGNNPHDVVKYEFDHNARHGELQVDCEWHPRMVRAIRLPNGCLPDLLICCFRSSTAENEYSETVTGRMLFPLVNYLVYFDVHVLGNDDIEHTSKDNTWDLRLALEYKRILRGIVGKVVHHINLLGKASRWWMD